MLTIGLLLLRLVVGLTVAAHGAQKLFGWWEGPGQAGFAGMLGSLGMRPARFWALVASAGEFAGGLLMAVGLLHPVGPLLVAGSMIVAILTVHLANGFWSSKRGIEFPLQILAAAVALSLTGPGAASIDALLGVRLPEPLTWIVLAALTFLACAAAVETPRLASRAARRRISLG